MEGRKGRVTHSSKSAQRSTSSTLVPESSWALWRRCTCDLYCGLSAVPVWPQRIRMDREQLNTVTCERAGEQLWGEQQLLWLCGIGSTLSFLMVSLLYLAAAASRGVHASFSSPSSSSSSLSRWRFWGALFVLRAGLMGAGAACVRRHESKERDRRVGEVWGRAGGGC